MKFNPLFSQLLNCSNESEVFVYLQNTFADSITLWDYFVNWNKVFSNYRDVEISLNLLNYLIGKENLEDEFSYLLINNPSLIKVFPILIACRNSDFKILTNFNNGEAHCHL